MNCWALKVGLAISPSLGEPSSDTFMGSSMEGGGAIIFQGNIFINVNAVFP